jgi:hypothetical protein
MSKILIIDDDRSVCEILASSAILKKCLDQVAKAALYAAVLSV